MAAKPKVAIIAGINTFLCAKLAATARNNGFRIIRTNKVDRIAKELKQPKRLCIIDMAWEEIQKLGQLKQFVNIGRISGNLVIGICPNTEENLKKMARASQMAKVFIRYELETALKKYVAEIEFKD